MPTYGYSDMINLVVDGHNKTLTRKSCEILMKRGMYSIENNKYMFSRDVRLKVNIHFYGTMNLEKLMVFLYVKQIKTDNLCILCFIS